MSECRATYSIQERHSEKAAVKMGDNFMREDGWRKTRRERIREEKRGKREGGKNKR